MFKRPTQFVQSLCLKNGFSHCEVMITFLISEYCRFSIINESSDCLRLMGVLGSKYHRQINVVLHT